MRKTGGKGAVIDSDGNEHPIEVGNVVYVNDDEVHGFKNLSNEPFDIICIVPDRGEK